MSHSLTFDTSVSRQLSHKKCHTIRKCHISTLVLIQQRHLVSILSNFLKPLSIFIGPNTWISHLHSSTLDWQFWSKSPTIVTTCLAWFSNHFPSSYGSWFCYCTSWPVLSFGWYPGSTLRNVDWQFSMRFGTLPQPLSTPPDPLPMLVPKDW